LSHLVQSSSSIRVLVKKIAQRDITETIRHKNVKNVMELVKHVTVVKKTVVILAKKICIYTKKNVLNHAQKVIMLKQLQRLVNNVTIIARLVMDQMKMTVYLVTSQDITIILHLLV
jgi:hypothetical protein